MFFPFPVFSALFLDFLNFLSIEPLFPLCSSELAPHEPGCDPVWAEGTKVGVSLRLLLGQREDLLPLGTVFHLMPLTIDKIFGWPLVLLLSLPLLAFLSPFIPSFLLLATRLLCMPSCTTTT